MADLTPKLRRKGQEYADKIAALAVQAPDTASKSDTYALAQAVRKRYGWSVERKRAEVKRVMALGCSTVSEIAGETHLTVEEVREIKRLLESDGEIRCEPLQNGAGRPGEMCFLVRDDLSDP